MHNILKMHIIIIITIRTIYPQQLDDIIFFLLKLYNVKYINIFVTCINDFFIRL